MAAETWPALAYASWRETAEALQLRCQIVGKIRLVQTPWINHSWQVTLYVTARGLTTGPIPHGDRSFQIDFDFIAHTLAIRASNGAERRLPLIAQSTAAFYAAVMGALDALNLPVAIDRRPNEIADAIPFDRDSRDRPYDGAAAQRFWQALVAIERVFTRFRSGFIGKVSPVHFFWGSFDLAVTRFSGRRAPPHPGGVPALPDAVVREAYSHEVSSAGFWPGGAGIDAAFYSYAYPEPAGFSATKLRVPQASYHEGLHEFLLPYEAVRNAAAPEELLLAFLQSTYAAAADLGKWDRGALECDFGQPGK